MSLTYQQSGVDIEAGDAFVERIKKRMEGHVQAFSGEDTFQRVRHGIGGFASVYDMQDGRYLVAGTDGVGTKLKLAQHLGTHNTIGTDLVAMCVNDILCTGARPLFFLDYLAMGKLDLSISEQIIEGILAGLKECRTPLVGGETAEMPGVYRVGEYDLAGFAVGEVYADQLIDGLRVKDGDIVIGLPSSGAHSNGFGLLRKLLEKTPNNLAQTALAPTKIYYPEIMKLRSLLGEKQESSLLKGLAHITGSGLFNVPRINGQFDYHLDLAPFKRHWKELFHYVVDQMDGNLEECFKTFNMGIGMMAVVDPEAIALLQRKFPFAYEILGTVKKGQGTVFLKSENTVLKFQ